MKNTKEKSLSTQGKVDLVYDTIKERIITTYYAPGEILSENIIAEEFKVSRTPVREAMKRLQQNHWLIMLQNVGMQVPTFDINHFKDLFSTKEALESLALKQAIDNIKNEDINTLHEYLDELKTAEPGNLDVLIKIDNKIHKKISEIANNSILEIYLSDIYERLLRTWLHVEKQGVGINKDLLYKTMAAIVKSLENRDKAAAERVEHEHMEYHRNEIRAGLF